MVNLEGVSNGRTRVLLKLLDTSSSTSSTLTSSSQPYSSSSSSSSDLMTSLSLITSTRKLIHPNILVSVGVCEDHNHSQQQQQQQQQKQQQQQQHNHQHHNQPYHGHNHHYHNHNQQNHHLLPHRSLNSSRRLPFQNLMLVYNDDVDFKNLKISLKKQNVPNLVKKHFYISQIFANFFQILFDLFDFFK